MMRPKSRKSRPKNSKPRSLQSEKVKHLYASLSNPKKTYENLPTEILTQIFEYLTLKELVQCGNTCQRWKLVISDTEKLWKMANLTGKEVPVSFLNHLCSRGTKYLSIQKARLIKDEEFSDIQESKFTHLNLSGTMSYDYRYQVSDVMEKLLKSCHFVKKLALKSEMLNPNFLTGIIQNASTLTVLNLWFCKGLTLDMIDAIFTNCQELTEVNIGVTSGQDRYSIFEEEEVGIFCKKISPKLQKLNLGGLQVKNCHIQKLVERCPNITELYLHATPLQDDCVDIIVKGFFKTLEKLQLPYFINLAALQERRNQLRALGPNDPRPIGPPKLSLGDLPNLTHLWFRQHSLEEDEKEILNRMLPKTIINRGNFYVARPNGAFWDVKCDRSDLFVAKEKPRMDYESLTYIQMRDFIMSQAYGDIPANP